MHCCYQVIFDEGLLVDAWFTNANMNESTLRNVDGSAGHDAERKIAKFDSASMNNVIICNSNFNDATFEDADLTNSVFNDCEPGDEISFLGTNLHNANFMGVFIPAVGSPPSFPSMIDGTSPISGESTDKSCFPHPYCDLEPVAGDTFVLLILLFLIHQIQFLLKLMVNISMKLMGNYFQFIQEMLLH